MGIVLNRGQQIACDAAIDWFYNSSSSLFQVAAEAGCGKSVLVGEIVKRLNLKSYEILPMAYTGQAAMVMRTHGLPNACTCHSGLFVPYQAPLLDDNGKPVIDYRFNTPVMIWKFEPKDFRGTEIKLIILDEAWMIPKRFKKFIDDTGIKVIATGDPGQLPPVRDEPGYLIDGTIYYLDELMRQDANSGLVYLARRIRRGGSLEYGQYGNVLVIGDAELTNNMISAANLVLCGTNNTRGIINNKVRNEILGYSSDYPHYGERIICRQNNWSKELEDGLPLVNGMAGTVINPPSLSSMDNKTKTFKIDFAPDVNINSPFFGLDVNYQFLNSKDQNEKDKIRRSRYTRGELFEYAYASTVHLAQGSEYSRGIYIEEWMGRREQAALNYTAITRFKDQLIIVKHTPKFWSFQNWM